MSGWGSNNAQASAPNYKIIEDKVAQNSSRGNSANLFNNVTAGVFHNNQVMGVFGANATQVSATGKIPMQGWHLVRQGTGPVVSFTITAGGTGYSNTDTVRVASAQTNATGTVTTNATGGITALTLTSGGSGFANVTGATVSFLAANGSASAGSGANVHPVLGGRAGRIHYECLVALGMKGAPPNTLP